MTKVTRIYSEDNHFQYLETLRRNRSKRSRTNTFFVEGVLAINQMIANRWEIEAFAHPHDRRLSEWAQQILNQQRAKVHYELPYGLMDKLSLKENTSELIAIPAIPPDSLARIPQAPVPLITVFDRISNPGNLGTLIRSCDSFGVDGAVLTGHAADLYAPETLRASVGSLFSVPVVRIASSKELLPWIELLKGKYPELAIIGTSAKADTVIHAFDFQQPTILIIGNETHGMSEFYREICDESVVIPITGSASSLNVACAATAVLYEVSRQRQPAIS